LYRRLFLATITLIALFVVTGGCGNGSGCGDIGMDSDAITITFNNGVQKSNPQVRIDASAIPDGTTVQVSGVGIMAEPAVVVPADVDKPAYITVNFNIDEKAELGQHTVTITRPNGFSSSAPYYVLPLGSTPLFLLSITPGDGKQGETFPVTITGNGILDGDVVVINGSGVRITTDSIVNGVVNGTCTIDGTARVQLLSVTITRANGLISNPIKFQVLPFSSNVVASDKTMISTSNLDSIPGGAVTLFPSIYSADITTTGMGFRNLTHASLSMSPDSQPRLSPDGTAIVFIRSESVTTNGGSVEVMDADGKNVRKVTPMGINGEVFSAFSQRPSFMPDGRHILFTNGTEKTRIAVMDVDGSNAHHLYPAANVPFSVTCPTHSMIGRTIAFSSSQQGQPDIWVMDEDGTNAHAMTNLGGTGNSAVHPVISPDGLLIVYEIDHLDNNHTKITDIHSIRLDGSEHLVITTDGKSFDPFTSGSGGNNKVYYVSTREGTSEIYSADHDGTAIHNLTMVGKAGAKFNDPSTLPLTRAAVEKQEPSRIPKSRTSIGAASGGRMTTR